MALSRGLNLGAPNATLINRPNTYNLAQALQGSAPPMQQAADGEDPAMRARRQALIDSLDSGMTAPLNGGGFGEALTRFGESYLRTKNGRGEREHEYRAEALANDRENRQAKLEERSALAQVLAQEQENKLGPEQWQDIPPDQLPQGARFGQRNTRTREANIDYEPAPPAALMTQWGPLSPEQQQQYPGLNPGDMQANQATGEIRQIPGAGQRVRATQQQTQRARAAMSRFEDQQVVIGAINRALEMAGSGETGAIGWAMRNVPGTQAFNLDRQMDVIRANIGFDALMEMRANSPTGGALGSTTENELRLLQSVFESLDQAQGTEQFRAGLSRLMEQYSRSMANIRAAYEQDFGQEMPDPAAAAPGPAANAPASRQQEIEQRLRQLDEEERALQQR